MFCVYDKFSLTNISKNNDNENTNKPKDEEYINKKYTEINQRVTIQISDIIYVILTANHGGKNIEIKLSRNLYNK